MDVFLRRLDELRGSYNVSAFSRLANIPQPSMDKYLKGRLPSIEILQSLCIRFGVSADWLLGLSDCRAPRGDAANSPRIAALEKKLHDLEVENAALQKALALLGSGVSRPLASPAKTGGASATKSA